MPHRVRLHAPATTAVAVALLTGIALACAWRRPTPVADPALGARGAGILAAFKAQLQGALHEALAEGADAAVEVCRVRAPAIAAGLATGGVRVGRTSHRLRNPANSPAPWMEPILAAYLEDPAARQPRLVRLEGERVGYAEPIVIQPMCVLCHGEAIPEPLRARLLALYPEDRATGFRVGDLRGIFWAEFPAPDRRGPSAP